MLSGIESDRYIKKIECAESIIYPYAAAYILSAQFWSDIVSFLSAAETGCLPQFLCGSLELPKAIALFDIKWYTYIFAFVLLIYLLRNMTTGLKDLAAILLIHPVFYFLIYRLCFDNLYSDLIEHY